MKKVLTMLGSVVLVASSASSVVACDNTKKYDISSDDYALDMHCEKFQSKLAVMTGKDLQKYMVDWFYENALKTVVHPAGFIATDHLHLSSVISDVMVDQKPLSIPIDDNLPKAFSDATKINSWIKFVINSGSDDKNKDNDHYFINSSQTLVWINWTPVPPAK